MERHDRQAAQRGNEAGRRGPQCVPGGGEEAGASEAASGNKEAGRRVMVTKLPFTCEGCKRHLWAEMEVLPEQGKGDYTAECPYCGFVTNGLVGRVLRVSENQRSET